VSRPQGPWLRAVCRSKAGFTGSWVFASVCERPGLLLSDSVCVSMAGGSCCTIWYEVYEVSLLGFVRVGRGAEPRWFCIV
jgi:hypothetical protein